MGVEGTEVSLEIEALVLPEGVVYHPEGFRDALTRHLTRLLAERSAAELAQLSAGTLRLESLSLTIPPGLDTDSAAADAAAQLLSHLIG